MKIALTGTPIENNLMEFWGLMKLLNPQIIGSYKTVFNDVDNQIEKMRVITSPFLLRRMKNNVLQDLPKKQEQILFVRMEPEQQILYNNMLKNIKHELERKSNRFEIKSNSTMLNGLLYLQEICCHPALLEQFKQTKGINSAKMELLFEIMEPLYQAGHKIVVFSRFTKMLKLIERRLLREHKNVFYLDGQTKNRMDIIDEFEQSKIGIFLVSLKAGGTGINLTSADIGIIYDPWWNPASEKQAEDRLYRIGQKNSVMIYRLITEGTIEEKVQQLKEKKQNITMQLLEGHEVPTSITKRMIEELLFD
jgi:snf2 family protein